MTRQMWRDLQGIPARLLPEVRCFILRGAGEHFCAGGDISEYPDFRFQRETLREFHEEEVAPALEALLGLDIPIVAMLQGHCMGGGLEIASCADIRIAGERASFGAPIAKLGMPMAQRELAVVLRAISSDTALQMLLEARIFSAQEMKERGFLSRLVSDDLLQQEVQQTAQRLCALSPQAARLNKQSLRLIFKQNQGLSLIKSAQSATHFIANDPYAYADSAEHQEGIAAFLEKRPAHF